MCMEHIGKIYSRSVEFEIVTIYEPHTFLNFIDIEGRCILLYLGKVGWGRLGGLSFYFICWY